MIIRNGVKVAVFNQDGLVLLMKRTDTDDRRPGEWDIPGGGVDEGEDFAQAAARELFEETGLKAIPSDLKVVYTNTMLYETGEVSANRMLLVWHTVNPEVTLSEEHDIQKWVPLETVLQEFPHPVYNAGLVYARDNGLL